MASDEESDERKADKKERKKSRKKHKKHRRRESESCSSDEDSYRRRRDKKKRRKKRDYSSDESDDRRGRKKHSKEYSSDSSTSSSNDRRREKKKRRKEKKKKKSASPAIPVFGQYGIIKASDFHKKQHSFQVWLAEVKGIQSFTGPRWEANNYFAEYCEDYNTATLPHIKYYDYDDWEMKEYRKKKQSQTAKISSSNIMMADEARHAEEMRERATEKEKAELDLLRSTMNVEKIQDMKRKAQLQSELAHAFKTGDIETQKRIQRKLEPDS
jgi:hypothetical protein